MTFHLSTPETKTKILISINVKCFRELVQYGAQQVLEREYGPYIVAPEPGYDFSVLIDLEDLPDDQTAREDLVMRLALMKRNAMAAPFEKAFDEFAQLAEEASRYTSESAPAGLEEGGEVMTIHYREEEAIHIKASHDRVTVIFSTVFREETDRIFGKVFLQEFVDARRRVLTLQNAPQVLFKNDPPLELANVPGLQNAGDGKVSYITFGTPPYLAGKFYTLIENSSFPSSFDSPTTPRKHFSHPDLSRLLPLPHQSIKGETYTLALSKHDSLIPIKAYIHTRMRKRTADFLQGTCQLSNSKSQIPNSCIADDIVTDQ